MVVIIVIVELNESELVENHKLKSLPYSFKFMPYNCKKLMKIRSSNVCVKKIVKS